MYEKSTSNTLLNTLLNRAHSNAAYATLTQVIIVNRFYPLSLLP